MNIDELNTNENNISKRKYMSLKSMTQEERIKHRKQQARQYSLNFRKRKQLELENTYQEAVEVKSKEYKINEEVNKKIIFEKEEIIKSQEKLLNNQKELLTYQCSQLEVKQLELEELEEEYIKQQELMQKNLQLISDLYVMINSQQLKINYLEQIVSSRLS